MARNDSILGGWPDSEKRRGVGRMHVDFDEDPEPPRRRRTMTRFVLLVGLIWAVLAGGAVTYSWISDFPDTANLLVYDPGNDITLVDVKGRMIARRGLTQGEVVALDRLPAYVGNAFIAIEDRRFRYHFGIDPFGPGARDALRTSSAGSFVQGGSTLTQQLAKNLFLKPERTFKRKFDEAILAVYLETRYTQGRDPRRSI